MRWTLLLAFAIPALAQSTCADTKAYSPCEIVFDLPAGAHPNPYATVDLRIEFRSPRRRTYAIPGFWDGGRRMVVRFSPTEGGAWDYHITSEFPGPRPDVHGPPSPAGFGISGFWARQAPCGTPRISTVADQLALPNRVAPSGGSRRLVFWPR